jgi:hypothetical protein
MKRRPKFPGSEEKSSVPAADASAILQVKVWLTGISPMVWRRVLVPSSFTLRELHGVIQVDTPPSEPNPTPYATSASPTAGRTQAGPAWLLAPADLPTGVQFALTAVVEASEISPDVMQALTQVAQAIQQASGDALPQARCGALTSCDNMTGDCGRLRHCGTYRSGGPSPL